MRIELTDTTTSQISSALVQARRSAGSPAMSMVLTLIVVADEDTYEDALAAASDAGREHPSRVLGVIMHGGREPARLDASVQIGDGHSGEAVLLRFYGQLARHANSVVMPLLLPESPVVVWWPGKAPDAPSADPIGVLGRRRVTDAAGLKRPLAALRKYAGNYAPGDTDLAWTRTTPWRSLLAAALDQYQCEVTGATVEAVRANASADLLVSWLAKRLRIEPKTKHSDGPGITAVRLHTTDGDIAITRPDGSLARYSIPGQPERTVALKRRSTSELLAEELRWLDPDDIYAETIEELLQGDQPANGSTRGKAKAPAKRATAKSTTAKSTTGKSTASKSGASKTTTGKRTTATSTTAKRASKRTRA